MFEPSLFRRDIHLRAFKVAIVVGCILATTNHGDAIFAHAMTTSSWLKVLLTFCVPYCVSWYSAVKTDTANIP
ncbi:MAG: nitrate/nitrite transporter NrtS [Pseudomonadota bacterium]|nr:nitrate/nitrite transporter NrtS [Pseudomonadota bacterium]